MGLWLYATSLLTGHTLPKKIPEKFPIYSMWVFSCCLLLIVIHKLIIRWDFVKVCKFTWWGDDAIVVYFRSGEVNNIWISILSLNLMWNKDEQYSLLVSSVIHFALAVPSFVPYIYTLFSISSFPSYCIAYHIYYFSLFFSYV